MKTLCLFPESRSAARRLVAGMAAVLWGAAACSARADWQVTSNLTAKAALGVRETYDSNVYLQDTDPAPGVPGAVPARHDSWVTTLLPQAGVAYEAGEACKVSLGYKGEYNWYSDAASEDHLLHRGLLDFSGRVKDTPWKLSNTLIYIDGSREGPVFGRPADIPAIGGIPMRDRREAMIYKGNLSVDQPLGGKWHLRPVATAYVHDFRTLQRPSPTPSLWVYENYVDRQQYTVGAHLGYDVGRNTRLSLGYIFGRQDQGELLGVNSPYDNYLHRVLVGLSGKPWKWLELGLMAGPDFRVFDNDIPRFDENEVLPYVLSTVTLIPGEQDRIVLFNKRYEQPAFGGPSMYEDVTYKVVWNHQFNPELSASFSFQAYEGLWKLPARREDWIFTPGVTVTYLWRKKLTVQVAYSYDWTHCALDGVPYSDNRDFSRHLGSLLVGWRF
jgi:hypothetical protein